MKAAIAADRRPGRAATAMRAAALLLTLGAPSGAGTQMVDAATRPPLFSTMPPGRELASWTPVRLGIGKRMTHYEWVEDDDTVVLHALAENAASGIAHRVSIDLREAPAMTWRWKIAGLIADAEPRTAAREDSPARIVLEFDGDKSKLTKIERLLYGIASSVLGREPPYATLSYIWSNHLPVGTVIPSPHTRRIQMIVASSGISRVGVWQPVVRDVYDDFRRAFGEPPGRLISVGVLTDTDDTHDRAEAWYGDIRFDETPR